MNNKVQPVKQAMLAVQRYPWEQGVCAQALWELGDITTAVARILCPAEPLRSPWQALL